MTTQNRPSTIKGNIDKLEFRDPFNYKKLIYIVNHFEEYEKDIGVITDNSQKHKYDAKSIIFKIKENTIISNDEIEEGYIKVLYRKGKNTTLGRYFVKNHIGIQSLPRKVRHTICDGFSYDLDMINAQPSLLYCIAKKQNINCPFLENYILHREEVFQNFIDEYNVDKDFVKEKIITVMNGGWYAKYALFKPLFDEIETIFKAIYHNTEYDDIYKEAIKKAQSKENDGENPNVKGCFMSLLLQTTECDVLENIVEFLEMNGYINNNNISLIFDGCQVSKDPTPILTDIENYVLEKTGYEIKLKVKPFDEKLVLPDDYADESDESEIIVDRYKSIMGDFQVKNEKMLNDVIVSDGTHQSVAELCYKFFKDTIKYDTKIECWFYCNTQNIWCKDKKALILQKLIPKVISKLFIQLSIKYNSSAFIEVDNNIKDILLDKSKKSLKISSQLCMTPFINNVMSRCTTLFAVDDFYENVLDSKGNLFAFKNKVFDFTTNQLRDIKPKDYIMTHTGYNYPENVEKQNTDFIQKYFDTLFPDDEVKNYTLDSFTSMLNGNKTEQYFNIFTGSGSNSKTTLINLYSSILGDYAVNVSPETFTKPKRNANDTGELYRCKGKRAVFANEPESNEDNKLQTAILKRVADEGNQTLICRALYSNPIEFKIQFTLMIICNNKPELSSVDDGVARRLRIVDFMVKFLDNPDENNKYQAKLDPTFISFVRDEGVRGAFIKILLDRWINRVSKFPKIPVPQSVMEASKEYVDDSNPVLGFIQEYYDITNNVNDKIKSSDLYQDFQNKTRLKNISSKRFKDDMKNIKIDSKRLTAGVCFLGLKKKVFDDEEDLE